jgi:hypothetical protein
VSGIFISYRRQDSAYIAGRLHDRLAAHFGPGQIFRDIDTIKPGVDFGQRIDDAVGSCDAFLVVIGDDWLEVRDAKDRRRLHAAKDWVRQEIRAALTRDDLLVVPVLVENARMPSEDELPASIRKLVRRNAMELTDQRWDYEVERLIRTLEEVVQPEQPVPSRAVGPEAGTDPAEQAEPHLDDRPPPAAARAAPRPPPWAPQPAVGPPRSLPPPPHKPRIPTWIKVVVPLVLVTAVILGALGVLADTVIERVRSTTGTTATTAAPETTTAVTVAPPTTVPVTPASTAPPTTKPTRVFTRQMSAKSGPFTLTVLKIEAAPAEVRVHIRVHNGSGSSLTLARPLFRAVDSLEHLYDPDAFAKGWSDDVPSGATVAGFIVLSEPLQPGATSMSKLGWDKAITSTGLQTIFVERYPLT